MFFKKNNKKILYSILFIIIVFLFLHTQELDLNTIELKNIITHNEIGTYNFTVHSKLFSLLNNDKLQEISILEIGAGNGISTQRFINYLVNRNISFYYDICEYDVNYYNLLCNNYCNVKNVTIYMNKWENLIYNKKKYDIIFITAFSTVNKNNYHHLQQLCHKNTILLTLSHFYINHDYGFKIINSDNYLLLKLYKLKLK